MSDRNAFDRQLQREIDHLAGPEPRVDVRHIVEGATSARRRPTLGRWLGLAPSAAATVLVLALVIGIGFFVLDRGVVVEPAATPTAEPTATASPDGESSVTSETPVAGSWLLAEPMACRTELPPFGRSSTMAVEICDGLRFETADDPRLAGSGHIRQEIWADAEAPEMWVLENAGGSWQSDRYYDHDRFVFRGQGGYDGLTAILTLAADGTLDGFVRTAEPRQGDE